MTALAHKKSDEFHALANFRAELVKVLPGKEAAADAMICAILASGHVLLEDVPGVGKTTVIKAMARLLGLEMHRIQCTSDLLPSDIIGVEVFNPSSQKFSFHPGPVFSNIVLADELNRASPRTQSALLEAMGEGFVTVDRETHRLPQPFVIFAAQNPSDHIGTYPLPESQLDRFSVKLKLDYPSAPQEKEIFRLASSDPLARLPSRVIERDQIVEYQSRLEKVFISDRITEYVKRVVDASRSAKGLRRGISTRGGVIWLRIARARALLCERDYVVPDDLIALAEACLCHRVIPQTGNDSRQVIADLLNQVDVEL